LPRPREVMAMALMVFWLTVGAEALATAAVLWSIAFPDRRIWPPLRQFSWQAYLMWVLFLLSGAGALGVGILDWGSVSLAAWARWLVGGPLFLAGHSLGLRAMRSMGLSTTCGGQSGLVLAGPYRFSRNPQYVGFIVALVGWAVLAGSVLALVAAAVGTAALVLAPFAEEPWLLEAHGPAYDEYRRMVPRFLSLGRPGAR
jgi:protein-S-isoprenylcysteine O-methyltransferase Ste14